MTAMLIGTPIGHPIASGRVYPNRPRIARPVSARIDPNVVTAVCGSSMVDQVQSVKAVDARDRATDWPWS